MGAEAKFKISAVDYTDQAFKSVDKKLNALANSFKSVVPIAVASAFASVPVAMAGIVTAAINTGDELNDLHERTGIAVEDLSGLGYVGKQTGTELGTIEKSLKYLNNKMLDAARGNKEAKRSFDDLNLTVTNSDGSMKDLMSLFLQASDSISGIKDESLAAAIAMDLFGSRSGAELVPMLKLGSAEILKMKQHQKDLGGQMTEEGAKAADEFKDTLNDLATAMSGVGNAMLPVLPIVTEYVKMSAEWIGKNKEVINSKIEDVVRLIGQGFQVIAENKEGIISIFEVVGKAAQLVMASVSGWLMIFDGMSKLNNMKGSIGSRDMLGGITNPASLSAISVGYDPSGGQFYDWTSNLKSKTKPAGKTYKPSGSRTGKPATLNKNADVFNDIGGNLNALAFDAFGTGSKVDEFHQEFIDKMDAINTKTKEVVPSISESWQTAYKEIDDSLMTTEDRFMSASYRIMDGWTNVFAGMTGEAYTFENVMKGIFDSILMAFRQTAAQMAAERLFKESAGWFGKGLNIASSIVGVKAAAPSGSYTNFPSGPASKTIIIKVDNASNSRIMSAVQEEMKRHRMARI